MHMSKLEFNETKSIDTCVGSVWSRIKERRQLNAYLRFSFNQWKEDATYDFFKNNLQSLLLPSFSANQEYLKLDTE